MDQLGATVRALREALAGSDYEIVISDGGSEDETIQVAKALACQVVTGSRGRAVQLNRGAAAARGRRLLFLHADTIVPGTLAAHLPDNLPASYRIAFTGQRRSIWLRFFAWCSRFDVPAFRYGDQGLLVRREDFVAIGGYDETLLLFEDNDIVRRLRQLRGGFTVHPLSVLTSDRRYFNNGVLFTQLVYVLLYLGFNWGVGQDKLYRLYDFLLGRERGSQG